MNKVLVKLYIPAIEEEYDIWIPMNRRVHNVIRLVINAVNDLVDGGYQPKTMPLLYDRQTANVYDINSSIRETNIRNGSELLLF